MSAFLEPRGISKGCGGVGSFPDVSVLPPHVAESIAFFAGPGRTDRPEMSSTSMAA